MNTSRFRALMLAVLAALLVGAPHAAPQSAGDPADPHAGHDHAPGEGHEDEVDPHAGHNHAPGEGHDHGSELSPAADSAFVAAVDLTPFGEIAVHTQGRLKSYESHAASIMQFVLGPRSYQEQTAGFTYLDMAFRPERYLGEDVVYVKNKALRASIVDGLLRAKSDLVRFGQVASGPALDARLAEFMEVGLISEDLLLTDEVRGVLAEASRDLIKTAKFVEMIEGALAWRDPGVLIGNLRIVPPPGGDEQTPWASVLEVVGRPGQMPPPFVDAELQAALIADWAALSVAWRAADATGVNASLARLAVLLPTFNVTVYPDASRLGWESWYFRNGNMTWVWMIYLLSAVVLLMGIVYRWPRALAAGKFIFLIAFGFHTFALGLRWYVSQRWPNSNMFEAVTTAAWFGSVSAVALEVWIARRRPSWKGVLALGAAVTSMIALMAAHYLPMALNASIGNMMPVLHDVWLYIHTNVIIWSYGFIFMAAISGILYLGFRMLGGAPDYVRLGGAGSLIAGDGGGAGAVASGGGTGGPNSRSSIGSVFDGVTMLLMEVSFVMLWAGIAMGAIWADHSWGRPWGWDPKEVFALNTFLVFAVLVHVRIKTKDKGLWTALLAIAGAAVMMFNWIVINFHIVGLHSYA